MPLLYRCHTQALPAHLRLWAYAFRCAVVNYYTCTDSDNEQQCFQRQVQQSDCQRQS